nr:hypothetical protein [uncultured Methanospirillum sp.]
MPCGLERITDPVSITSGRHLPDAASSSLAAHNTTCRSSSSSGEEQTSAPDTFLEVNPF